MIKEDSLKETLNKMQVDAKSHVIINFGFGGDNLVSSNIVKELNVINVKNDYGQFISRNLYVLPLDSLPSISLTELGEAEIEKYSLVKNEDFNIYTSVIDLNLNAEKTTSIVGEFTEDNRMKVFMATLFNIEYKWRNNSEIVRIEEHTFFNDENVLSNIERIKKIRK